MQCASSTTKRRYAGFGERFDNLRLPELLRRDEYVLEFAARSLVNASRVACGGRGRIDRGGRLVVRLFGEWNRADRAAAPAAD